MQRLRMGVQPRTACACLLFLAFLLVLTGCGGSSMSATSNSAAVPQSAHTSEGSAFDKSSASGQSSSGGQAVSPKPVSQQRLIKALSLTLAVKDTRKVANELQSWISATDPQATSVGTNYDQLGQDLYNVTLQISVQYTLYPKIYNYLSNYAPQDGGRLVNLNESVKDVSGQYVDTQEQLKTYRIELDRLRDFLKQSNSLTDTLTIEQRITDVEGNIERTQAELNSLNSQTTMYTITISLQPLNSAAPPIQPNTGWDAGRIVRDALSASLTFLQGLIGFVIWLLAFSIYIVPLVLLVVLYRRYRARHPKPVQQSYYRPAQPQTPRYQPSVEPAPAQANAAEDAPKATGNTPDLEAEEEKTPVGSSTSSEV